MKLINFIAGAIVFCGIFLTSTAKAVCPVCIVAVGAGLGLSRWLGVDDIISGLWIGGLLFSLSLWTIFWLELKNWSFKFSKFVIPAVYYLLVLLPLYFSDAIGHPLNKIFGIDKFIFGAGFGTLAFWAGEKLSDFLKSKNQGKAFFLYQKVIVPVSVLLIISIGVYFII